MTAIESAQAFLKQTKDLGRDAFKALYATLTPDVKKKYRQLSKAEFFTPERAKTEALKEHFSPSGKYKLVVTPFETSSGAWAYTQGLVFAVGQDIHIAEIQRNYSSFPFLWIEGHSKGDFLVAGEDYQGSTVIELGTGKRLDFSPAEAEEGHGFCWGEYEFHAATATLIVTGCYWAAPYEYRFYDFSDPMAGWPEIESDTCIYDDTKKPTIEADGTIRCYHPCTDEDGEPTDSMASIQTLQRDGLKLTLLSEWVSETEQKKRVEHKESQRNYEAKMVAFRASDPLYLAYKDLVQDPSLSPDTYESVGITYENWCPTFAEQEQRMCRRILNKSEAQPYTVDLEWATVSGPIKLGIYKGGKHLEDKFFEHSVAAMHEAFKYAKGLSCP